MVEKIDIKTIFESQMNEVIPLSKDIKRSYFDGEQAKTGDYVLYALLKLNNQDSPTFELITLNEKHFHLFKAMDQQSNKMLPQLIKL